MENAGHMENAKPMENSRSEEKCRFSVRVKVRETFLEKFTYILFLSLEDKIISLFEFLCNALSSI